MVTPKRPEATCLIAERMKSPLGSLVAIGLLAALASVRLAADSVDRDRQSGVRLTRDRAEAHRAGGEALHDRRGGLDFVERYRRVGEL